MFQLNSARVAKPLDLVGVGMLHLDQLELGAQFFTCQVMATTSIDDDLHGTTFDARLGVEDMTSLVFVLLMLKSQDLGDNKSGARIFVTKDMIIFIIVHLAVHSHILKGFYFSFTHEVICTVIVEDHGALVGTLEGLVASAAASEALDGTCLDGLIGWSR
jgi:hypothetical protein